MIVAFCPLEQQVHGISINLFRTIYKNFLLFNFAHKALSKYASNIFA